MGGLTIQLGDVAQDEQIGRLGVVAPINPNLVAEVDPTRLYL